MVTIEPGRDDAARAPGYEMPRRLMLTGVIAAIMGGCSSSDPQLFTLAPAPAAHAYPGSWLVEVRRVSLPAYLDRPEIVQATDGYRVMLAANQRWAEPLADMLDRVLRQDLMLRLPGATVFSESGAITADPAVIVEADIQRFDTTGDGNVLLLGQFAVRSPRSHTALAAQPVRVIVPVAGGSAAGIPPLVAALSTALAQLADAMADAVSRIAPSEARAAR